MLFASKYDFSLLRKQTKDADSLTVVGILFQDSAQVKRTDLFLCQENVIFRSL